MVRCCTGASCGLLAVKSAMLVHGIDIVHHIPVLICLVQVLGR